MAKKSSSRTPASSSPRVSRSAKQARTQDDSCTVRVYLTGNDSASGKPLTNNITATLYVRDMKVSELAELIEGAIE